MFFFIILVTTAAPYFFCTLTPLISISWPNNQVCFFRVINWRCKSLVSQKRVKHFMMMIILLLWFIILYPSKSIRTSVSCPNYSKCSYFYVFKNYIFVHLNNFLGCFHYFGHHSRSIFYFAPFPLSSQYFNIIISCASLEQLMGAVSHSFLEKSTTYHDDVDDYFSSEY